MTSKKKIQAPWLLKPVWYNFPMHKGLGHHRTSVGIILAANQKLTLTLESSSLKAVEVRLLNDGDKTEDRFKIKSSDPGRSGTVNVNAVSVPFLDCEYLQKAPEDNRTVRISYPSDSKILPTYRFGNREDEFFKLWDEQDAEFAYVESDYFSLLIPKIDKEVTRKLPNGQNLDGLIVFYDKIFTTYNELVGLSFEASGIDLNVRNRFFLKADKDGNPKAWAYYGIAYSAVVSNSIKSFWLEVGPTNWGAIHEIGHGYQLQLTDESLNVAEVWNNILCFFYQAIMFGKELKKKGSKIKDMDIKGLIMYPIIKVKEWGLIAKLSFLVHMFLKSGQKSVTRFHHLFRQEFSGIPFYASGLLLTEKLMHFFAIDFAIDVYPFMKLVKAQIGEEQLYDHYYVLSHVAYPLNLTLLDKRILPAVQEKLGLLFETGLVTPQDLSSTKLKSDFIVNMDEKLSKDLYGDTLKLMDGSRVVVEQKIQSKSVTLRDVPIGVYKVFIEPNRSNVKFIYDNFYAIVQDRDEDEIPNDLLLSAKELKEPILLPPDKINFIGWGRDFAYLSIEPFKHVVRFNYYSDQPHALFENELYVSIVIKNQKKEVIFSKSINGDDRKAGSYDIPMNEELEIEIFHAETKDRLETEDALLDEVIDRASNTNYLIVSEQGVRNKNKKIPEDIPEKLFLNKIDICAKKIEGKASLYERPYCLQKYHLLLAVEAFERFFRKGSVDKTVREKYKDCLPPPADAEIQRFRN